MKVLTHKILPIIASVIVFFGSWAWFASNLYENEKDRMLSETAKTDSKEAADAQLECIEAETCEQPNTLPSPAKVWSAAKILWGDHVDISSKKTEFEKKVAKINEKNEAAGKPLITYTGRPSFVDQIETSLVTVFSGFLLAALIAIPLGIITGLSPVLKTSISWIIQILRPVSPVVWFLLVYMIVIPILKDSEADKAYVVSFIAVGLCAMWATLVNTAMGVSSVSPDYVNVAKVMKLSTLKNVFKIIIPSSVPLIFTGLRITLSVSWMVLIAIELLAQNPGLGSFVWEEFQNGSSESNAKIIVAMFLIGIIGFILDQIMATVQKLTSFDAPRVSIGELVVISMLVVFTLCVGIFSTGWLFPFVGLAIILAAGIYNFKTKSVSA